MVVIMELLIKQIREAMGLSQEEFGARLSASFSTVNRWENGKSYPNKMAQHNIYMLADRAGVDVHKFINSRIENIVKSIKTEPERIILYHGSKSGVTGPIRLISRQKCDFGRGFYMGTIPEQPLTLICDYEQSIFYVVSIATKGLKILDISNGLDWAMFVAFNRGKMDEAIGTAFYEKYLEMSKGADIIAGNIADDRIFYVLDNFFQGNITDQALINSLSALKLGKQYVAITQKACDMINIEAEIKLSELERKCLQDIAEKKRTEGISMAKDICRNYRREGLFFDEILSRVKG